MSYTKKLEILDRIEKLKNKNILPSYESLEKDGFERSLIRSMVKDGWLYESHGYLSLTEKGLDWLLKYRSSYMYSEKEKNKTEKILFNINKLLDEIKKVRRSLSQHPVDIRYTKDSRIYVIFSDDLIENLERIENLFSMILRRYKSKNFGDIDFNPKYKFKDILYESINKNGIIQHRAYRYLDDLTTILENMKFDLEKQLDIYNISSENKAKIHILHEEIKKLETEILDEDIIKNLKESLKELENGHFLASELIAARVIDYCINRIDGKTIEEKCETLLKYGIIDRKNKKEKYLFIRSSKKARDFISHDIKSYSSPNDVVMRITEAIHITKLYNQYLLKHGERG